MCVALLIYVGIVFLMKKFRKKKLTNFIFFVVTFLCYLSVVLIVYLDVGLHDWNFLNTLPTANVSPFMFCTLPLCFILPNKIKKYHFALISLLSVGMLLAPAVGCIYNTAIKYAFHTHFLLDYAAHFTLSLWGIYLVKSKQVELNVKNGLIGGSVIVVVAFLMMILNVIFDTAFFGLSLNGKHNIYNCVLVKNSFLSALIYFAGLVGVLVLGYFCHKLINIKKKEKTEQT